MPRSARSPTDTEQGFFSGFPRMQGGMFVMLCNTIFNYCNFNLYIYIYIYVPYIQIFLVWPFMPKNRKCSHSIWWILYSKPLDLKCVKWIKSTLCCDCYTKINLFFYSAQLWAQKFGKPCSIEDAITLHDKYVCKNHFLERDFTTSKWSVVCVDYESSTSVARVSAFEPLWHFRRLVQWPRNAMHSEVLPCYEAAELLLLLLWPADCSSNCGMDLFGTSSHSGFLFSECSFVSQGKRDILLSPWVNYSVFQPIVAWNFLVSEKIGPRAHQVC